MEVYIDFVNMMSNIDQDVMMELIADDALKDAQSIRREWKEWGKKKPSK